MAECMIYNRTVGILLRHPKGKPSAQFAFCLDLKKRGKKFCFLLLAVMLEMLCVCVCGREVLGLMDHFIEHHTSDHRILARISKTLVE